MPSGRGPTRGCPALPATPSTSRRPARHGSRLRNQTWDPTASGTVTARHSGHQHGEPGGAHRHTRHGRRAVRRRARGHVRVPDRRPPLPRRQRQQSPGQPWRILGHDHAPASKLTAGPVTEAAGVVPKITWPAPRMLDVRLEREAAACEMNAKYSTERTQRVDERTESLPLHSGEIRTAADLSPSPCMIGTAELPGYLASYAKSIASESSSPPLRT